VDKQGEHCELAHGIAEPPGSTAVDNRVKAVGPEAVSCPVRLERSLFVEGAAVAGESDEDLLGALVPGKGSGVVVPMARIVVE
jgi:hypothetical protein